MAEKLGASSCGCSSGGRLRWGRQRCVDARECRLPGAVAGAVAPRDKVDGRTELGGQLVVGTLHDTRESDTLLPAKELPAGLEGDRQQGRGACNYGIAQRGISHMLYSHSVKEYWSICTHLGLPPSNSPCEMKMSGASCCVFLIKSFPWKTRQNTMM